MTCPQELYSLKQAVLRDDRDIPILDVRGRAKWVWEKQEKVWNVHITKPEFPDKYCCNKMTIVVDEAHLWSWGNNWRGIIYFCRECGKVGHKGD